MTIILYNLDEHKEELFKIVSNQYFSLSFQNFRELSESLTKNKIDGAIVLTNSNSIEVLKKVLPRHSHYILVENVTEEEAKEKGFFDVLNFPFKPLDVLEKMEKAQFHIMYEKNNQPNILEENENIYDDETALFNRTFMGHYFSIQKRLLKSSMIVLFHFEGLKIIKDLYGEDIKTNVLLNLIDQIKETFPMLILSRYYEYEIIGSSVDHEVERLEEKIKNIQKSIIIEHEQLPIDVVLGYELYDPSNENITDIITRSRQMAIENKRISLAVNKKTYLAKLKDTLAATNYESKNHLINLQLLANDFANHLKLDHKNRQSLLDAVTLHDIGKLGVPKEILEKDTKLTKEEFEKIKKHPEYGYQICLSEGFSPAVLSAILHHHERFDGLGYPKGLKGERIPFLARIVTILDSYEVMTRGRVYKKAMSKEEAIEELINCSGTQFDPKLVDKFIELIR